MINHLYITLWKWDTVAGTKERYFAPAPAFDIDLALEGNVGSAVTTVKAQDSGERLTISDVQLQCANKIVNAPPLGLIWAKIFGNIDDGTWGIIAPILESAGNTVIIAEIIAYGLRQAKTLTTVPVDASLQAGAIDSYDEFIEDIDTEDNVVILPGYLELKLAQTDEYTNSVQFSIIALDKLVELVLLSGLTTYPLISFEVLIQTILDGFPFATALNYTKQAFGNLPWIVPIERQADLSVLPILATDTTFDSFDLYPKDNAKIIVWQFGDDVTNSIFYVKLKTAT
jgi:hypothetical protein